ncbi:hypothetical protein BDV25DRAFT_144172 [Aspergillus avenaceus]|uniref:BRCT domain-containing protein n=1 Tax=Aspergillus avenaceus TaxID=36643 RepID=A0A5N6THZ4_ASPAV|nr:hypothetical protein BDV25DRAFT_144172 [Aspergillus avenaceus]
MESQDDSLDIAKLQRVALGLESAPSQLYYQKSEAVKGITSDCLSDHQSPNSGGGQPSIGQKPSRESPSNCPRSPYIRSLSQKQNDRSLTNSATRSPPKHTQRPHTSGSRSIGKMSSAETVPSDTQVISQSVYDDLIRQNKEAADRGSDSNLADDATLRTLHEGDTGHVDLLAGLDGPIHSIVTEENTDENEDQSSLRLGESSPMHYQPNLFPESQRFVSNTPATAVKSGSVDGLATETPTASRNPLATDLESSGGIMALSQVFRATQAPSSPLVNRQQSDPMSDRPSPNLPIQNHPHATALSSPLTNLAATFPQDTSEAQYNYITMKESQAQRDRILRERMARSAEHIYSDDHSDGGLDKEPSFVEHMRRQRMIEEETRPQLATLSAPARPSSCKNPGEPCVSPWGQSDSRDGANAAKPAVLEEDQQGTVAAGVTSEEETEQEEEPCQQVSRSQELNATTEEDKENCNDLAATTLAAATNAHDRLSQALNLDKSPVFNRNSHFQSEGHDQDEQPNEANSSSQVYIVKDSQRSPGGQTDEDHRDKIAGRCNPNQAQNCGPKLLTAGSPEKVWSPTKQIHLQSTPPSASQRSRVSFQLDEDRIVTRSRTNSVSSRGSPGRFPNNLSGRENGVIQSNSRVIQNSIEFNDEASGSAPKEKSSSMPSRVAETPVQRPKKFGDVVAATTIPETSPNRFDHRGWPSDANDAMDQEDDDLPPVYPSSHERAHHSQPVMSGSSSPVKTFFNSKILSSPSGRQRRALTEIAADASPQAGTGPFDVDINILTADDREFRSAVELSPVPPRKRRRGNDGQSIFASDPVLPVTPHSSTNIAPPIEDDIMMMQDLQADAATTNSAEAFVKRSRPSRRSNTVWDVDDSPNYYVPRRERSRLFGLSRPRLNEEKVKQVHGSRESTELQPVIIQDNQDATLQDALPQDALPQDALPQDALPQDALPQDALPQDAISQDAIPQDTIPQDAIPQDAIPQDAIPQDATSREATPLPTDQSNEARNETRSENSVERNTVTVTPVPDSQYEIATNQVLAAWSGTKRAFYPATCFGNPLGTSQTRYLVKFEDSNPVEVPVGAVKRLELRVGDAVKVDMPNVPKVTHIIRGFEDKLSIGDLEREASNGIIPMTDVYGYSTVVLGQKQRKSLTREGLVVPENLVKVPIARIYLDTILWNQLKDRKYTYSSVASPAESKLQTPSDRHTTPASPSTRLSRSIRYSNGIFAGMVFAVSYGNNDEAKSRITQMILNNDGRILQEGFNELFDLPLNRPSTTPSKVPSTPIPNNSHFRLSSGAEDVGFACLIADKHSRRPKYMQALALNLPCLSDRWIEDCVSQGRVVEWELYLLPAGESSYLNGATKSRFLVPYPAPHARLSETVAARPNLLSGQSVLVVMGRGKADEERRKAYLFLTYALGASRVERVPDIKSARAVLGQGGSGAACEWNWIYVDNDEKASAIATILGASVPGGQKLSTSQRTRKRKRNELSESISGSDLGLSSNVRIVGNEFVCQSLILGKLID